MNTLNAPHGGRLIERYTRDDTQQAELLARAYESPSVILDQTALTDLEMLGNGALSPLSGFLGEEDFRSVVEGMRLSNGLPWTIPIVLGADRVTVKNLNEGKAVALSDKTGKLFGLLDLTEIYLNDVRTHAHAVFGTDEEYHPGVGRVLRIGEYLLAGQVTALPIQSQ